MFSENLFYLRQIICSSLKVLSMSVRWGIQKKTHAKALIVFTGIMGIMDCLFASFALSVYHCVCLCVCHSQLDILCILFQTTSSTHKQLAHA